MKLLIRKAAVSDIDAISSVLNPYSRNGIILERSREELRENIGRIFIAEIKRSIVGVISYYIYSNRLIEIRSLAVIEDYYKKGIGSGLLKTLLDSLSNEFPNAKIFALTYNPDFFKQFSFIEVEKDSLPEKIWKDCQNCLDKEECGESALIFSKS